jgi:hypothetical protein
MNECKLRGDPPSMPPIDETERLLSASPSSSPSELAHSLDSSCRSSIERAMPSDERPSMLWLSECARRFRLSEDLPSTLRLSDSAVSPAT